MDLLDLIAEVHVVGVLEDHHAFRRRRALEELAHAREAAGSCRVGDEEERRHVASPREVERLCERLGRKRRPAAGGRERQRRAHAAVAARDHRASSSRRSCARSCRCGRRRAPADPRTPASRRSITKLTSTGRAGMTSERIASGVGRRTAHLRRHHHLDGLEDRVAGVVHRRDHVAVAREMGAEEGRLPAMRAEAVREHHEREASGARRRVAHGVLPAPAGSPGSARRCRASPRRRPARDASSVAGYQTSTVSRRSFAIGIAPVEGADTDGESRRVRRDRRPWRALKRAAAVGDQTHRRDRWWGQFASRVGGGRVSVGPPPGLTEVSRVDGALRPHFRRALLTEITRARRVDPAAAHTGRARPSLAQTDPTPPRLSTLRPFTIATSCYTRRSPCGSSLGTSTAFAPVRGRGC